MKKTICTILLAALILCLCACAAEPEWKPYTGSMEGYVYYHETERERAWEEDVLSLANTFLTEHPLLLNEKLFMRYYSIQGFSMTKKNLYNEALHTDFLKAINDLIPRLSELTDDQIPYELQKIVAALGDAHSQVLLSAAYFFPMLAEPFYVGGEVELRMVALPTEHKDLISAKLVSINGVAIEEVIKRLEPYASVENEYGLISRISDVDLGGMLYHPGLLTEVGILKTESQAADFVLLTEEDEQRTISVSPVRADQIQNTTIENWSVFRTYQYSFQNWYEENFWYELWPEENTAYVRINRFFEEEDETLKQMSEALMGELRENEQIDKIILDLRRNSGGLVGLEGFPRLMQALRLPQIKDVCVLIDHGTLSRSVSVAFEIQKETDTATLIGTPAGEGSFIIGLDEGDRTLPNSGLAYIIGTEACDLNREQPFDALLPDITVYPTLEDYKNGVDTILEAAKSK